MFVLSAYLYPFKNPILISQKLHFYFDNPRTKEEIKLVEEYITVTLNGSNEFNKLNFEPRIPVKPKQENDQSYSLKDVIKYFIRAYSEVDPYIEEFIKDCNAESPLNTLVKMWVIVRCVDNETIDINLEKRAPITLIGNEGVYFMDHSHPTIINHKNIINFTYLLSLLVNSEGNMYQGTSFLIQKNLISLFFPNYDILVNRSIILFAKLSIYIDLQYIRDIWCSFFHIKDSITQVGKNIDSILNSKNKEKLLYISYLLRVCNSEVQDERMKLVTLVSIIELILVKNNSRRISKEFREKTLCLIRRNNSNYNWKKVKTKLREIYKLRSNIAHGNFNELDNYLKQKIDKRKSPNMDKDVILKGFNSDLYYFIKVIMEEYIKDPKYIENLRNR